MVLSALFQSSGTVQLVPLVRNMRIVLTPATVSPAVASSVMVSL
jgi:hypothetical protein